MIDLGTNLSSPRSQESSELPTQPSPQNATQDPAKLLSGEIRAQGRQLWKSLWAERRNYFLSLPQFKTTAGIWDNQTAWKQPLYRDFSWPTLSLEISKCKHFLPWLPQGHRQQPWSESLHPAVKYLDYTGQVLFWQTVNVSIFFSSRVVWKGERRAFRALRVFDVDL